MKQAELVYVQDGRASVIDSGSFPLMQFRKNALKKSPQFFKGLLQVRSKGAKDYQLILKKKQ